MQMLPTRSVETPSRNSAQEERNVRFVAERLYGAGVENPVDAVHGKSGSIKSTEPLL
jgi:hypothetical protein